MTNTEKQAIKIGWALRNQLRKRGEFKQADFEEELARRLEKFRKKAFDSLVYYVADIIDRKRSNKSYDEQPNLPGFDLEDEYRLGDGRRIAKRLATADHAREALDIDDTNLDRVQAANNRKHDEYLKLLPYWGPGVTKEQAVAAYWAANPPSQVG